MRQQVGLLALAEKFITLAITTTIITTAFEIKFVFIIVIFLLLLLLEFGKEVFVNHLRQYIVYCLLKQ